MAARHQFVVLSNPVDGREDEYNRWYDEVHIHEMVQVPGFVSAQRYRIDPVFVGSPAHRYAALYDMETDDPAATLAELTKAGSSMRPFDAFDFAGAMAFVLSPVGDRVTASPRTTDT
jgi:hypothetical protein